VNLRGDNTDAIKKKHKTLIDASKGAVLELNTEKSKYMLLYRHQNAVHNHDIKKTNRYFENVAHLKCLGTTVTNQNLIQKEIEGKLNSGSTLLPFSPEPFVFSSAV
jgi:hypothetical protein